MSEKDGGPAFPTADFVAEGETTKWFLPRGGMSLRDYFAGRSISCLMSQNTVLNLLINCYQEDRIRFVKNVSKVSYEIADAMMEERKKP